MGGGTAGLRFPLQDREILVCEGDLTQHEVDVVVNAANPSLLGGGGVDGAIHRAAGPGLLEECRRVARERAPLPAGEAVVTGAGRMPARYIIHTVGPVWRGGGAGEREKLQSCYRRSMQLADELTAHSIAFPAISTGVYGYPMREAAEAALGTIAEELSRTRALRQARFVLFGELSYAVFCQAARDLLGQSPGPADAQKKADRRQLEDV